MGQNPPGIKKAVQNNKRPTPAQRRAMVRVIVDEMKKHQKNPNLAQASTVAERVVCLHPDSFEHRSDERERLASGFHVLAKQLKNRIENVNWDIELEERMRRPRVKANGSGCPAQGPIRTPSGAYGCIKWQPDLPSGESEASQQEKKQQLTDLFTRDGPKLQTAIVDELMQDTYYLQRKSHQCCSCLSGARTGR